MKLLTSLLLGAVVIGLLGAGAPALMVAAGERISPDVVFAGPDTQPRVALTIDDGPSASTRAILGVLREHGARASFFVIGEHLARDEDAARAIVAQGSEIGHHMMTGEPSIRLADGEFVRQFDRMDALTAGLRTSKLFRPGSGWFDAEMVEAVERRGYRLVLGSIYPFDAQIASVPFASWYILQQVRPGAIIVLHEGSGRGRRTAEILRGILPELDRQGYEVTTVTELLEDSQAGVLGWSEPRPTMSSHRGSAQ